MNSFLTYFFYGIYSARGGQTNCADGFFLTIPSWLLPLTSAEILQLAMYLLLQSACYVQYVAHARSKLTITVCVRAYAHVFIFYKQALKAALQSMQSSLEAVSQYLDSSPTALPDWLAIQLMAAQETTETLVDKVNSIKACAGVGSQIILDIEDE